MCIRGTVHKNKQKIPSGGIFIGSVKILKITELHFHMKVDYCLHVSELVLKLPKIPSLEMFCSLFSYVVSA